MLQINFVRENNQKIIDRLKARNFDASGIVEKIIDVDVKRREAQKNLDNNLAKSNALARQIGELFKSGKKDEAEKVKEQTTQLKQENKELQKELEKYKEEQETLLIQLPNIPHEAVKPGNTEDDNEIIFQSETDLKYSKDLLPHWDLATQYDLVDFELGNKVTGSGFPVYKGKGAKLQRALVSFFLDKAIEEGYAEYQIPLVVNEDSAFGTGQLPDKDGQMYHIPLDNLFLIPTSEVPVTNIYRDVILPESAFPVKCTAYSTCFRREAGSYGKDVRGLNRLHQFDKVEIVQIVKPENSYDVLDEMVNYVTSLVKLLELPYRITRLCGGDLGFAAAMTYDIEVFSSAQNKWLEVSSISNFEAFQANRMKLRYRDGQGKIHPAHTLNGSALALPRIVAALIENNQHENGINIPGALVPYTGFDSIL